MEIMEPPIPIPPEPVAKIETQSTQKISIVFTSNVFKDPDDFEAFRMARVDCDLELRFFTQPTVYAHKVILRRRSPFFSRKLAQDPECNFLELMSPLESAFIEILVKFIYTGKLEIIISRKNLMHLIVTAKELEIEEINLNTCVDLLKEKLCPKSCWLLKEVALDLVMRLLEAHIQKWMKRNFKAIVAEVEFLGIQFDTILEFVQIASREYTSEMDILEGILKWVNHDVEQRKERLFDLVKTLNLEQIFNKDPEFLRDKFQEGSLLDNDPHCSKAFNQICRNKAFEYSVRIKKQETELLNGPGPSSASTDRSPLPKPYPDIKPFTIKIVPLDTTMTPKSEFKSAKHSDRQLRPRAGSTEKSSKRAELPEAEANNDSDSSDVELITKKRRVTIKKSVSFHEHLQKLKPSSHTGEMKLLNFRKQGSTTYFQVYNFDTNINKNLYQLRRPREASSIVMVEDSVYHIGGELKNSIESVTDVDIYSPTCRKGYHGPNLVQPTKNAAACVYDNAIYVIGGEELNGSDSCAHNTTQRLDLSNAKSNKRQWKLLEYMHHIRDSLGVAVLGNKIYAAGGFGTCFKLHEDTYPLNTVEAYTPETNDWELLKSSYLKVPRAHMKLCSMDNKLYAVGGFNYEISPLNPSPKRNEKIDRKLIVLNTVEMYDPSRGNNWTYVANMNDERHSAAVFTKNGLLYAIGGNTGSTPTAEFYDPRINMWQYLTWPSELPNKEDVKYHFAVNIP